MPSPNRASAPAASPASRTCGAEKALFGLEPAQRVALQFVFLQAVAMPPELIRQRLPQGDLRFDRIHIAVVDAAHPHRPAVFQGREIPRVPQDALRDIQKVEIGVGLDVEGFLRPRLGDDLQQAGGMGGFVRDDEAPDDAVRPVCADHHRGAVLALIGFEQHFGPADGNAFNRRILLDEETGFTRLARQPGIELVPADGAEGVRALFLAAHAQAPAVVIEMRPVHVAVRDFRAVQPQRLQDHFRIRYQAAAAQFGARVARFFQDERTWDQIRRESVPGAARWKSRPGLPLQ